MAHNHAHTHTHDHSHTVTSVNKALIIGVILNASFVVVEALTGFFTHSLALLTDAGHNLSDVASLMLALLAFRLAKIKPNQQYTYGFQKSTILVALTNAFILLLAIGAIVWEAMQRFGKPNAIEGKTVALVALVGIVINAISAFLFFKDKEKDLNLKSAYLHLAADALVSLGVVVGGILMIYTQWFWLDSVLSIIIAVVIFVSTWSLLKDTLRLGLDGVPTNVDYEAVKKTIDQDALVKNLHHLHIWAISTTKNALTAHLVVENYTETATLRKRLKHELEHLNVQHCTFEIELENECKTTDCEED